MGYAAALRSVRRPSRAVSRRARKSTMLSVRPNTATESTIATQAPRAWLEIESQASQPAPAAIAPQAVVTTARVAIPSSPWRFVARRKITASTTAPSNWPTPTPHTSPVAATSEIEHATMTIELNPVARRAAPASPRP